uniref:Translocation and assembly module TamB n=1 Tax=Candidatus Kentrum sp. TC TaxID=2126339 RepID=A0A450ZTU6_9GAMM|nr:MAG: translocation and assembly module TamB [Candidatus Kentron sp. TC]
MAPLENTRYMTKPRRLVFLLSIPLVVTILAGGGLVATEFGARWFLQHALPGISAMTSGDRIRIGNVEGTLLSPLTLSEIAHHPADFSEPTTIANMVLEWRPRALFSGLLHISRLRLEGIRYAISDGNNDQGIARESAPPSRLPLPLALRLDRMEIVDLQVARGADHYHAQRIAAGPITFAGGAKPILIQRLEVASEVGKLSVAMEIDPVAPFAYKVSGNGRATFPDGTVFVGEGGLHGDASGAIVEEFSAKIREARVSGRGSLDWSRGLSWDLVLSARELDPNIHRLLWRPESKDDWAGSLNLELRGRGHADDHGPDVTVEIERFDGVLRGYSVAASGGLGLVGRRIELRDLKLRGGDNRLRIHGAAPLPKGLLQEVGAASGNADPTLDLVFEIDAPMLDAFWPGLGGQLRGRGRFDGPLSKPKLHLRMTGEKLAYREYGISALQAELALDSTTSASSRATIEAKNVVLANHEFPRLRVRGEGYQALDKITLGIDFLCQSGAGVEAFLCAETPGRPISRDGHLMVRLHGGLKDGVWSGNLESADIQSGSSEDWKLVAPIPLMFGGNAMQVGRVSATGSKGAFRKATGSQGRACWQRREARICAGGGWSRDLGFDIEGDMAGLSWRIFRPWLPDALEVRGVIGANFDIHGLPDTEEFDAHLKVMPEPGVLRYRAPDREPLETTFRDARLMASYARGGLDVDVGIGIAEKGTIKGKLRVGAASAEYPLQGMLQARLPDSGPLAAFVPQAGELKGALAFDFTVGGTARVPALHGRASLTEGAMDLLAPGVELQDISLVVEGRRKQPLKITGAATSGPGRITFAGEVRHPLDASRRIELSVRGDAFQALRLPEAELLFSPDLRIVSDREETVIDGKISIPEATVKIDALSDTGITVSEDEVILGKEPEPTEGAPGHAVRAQVEVILGDRVSFHGFGLDAKLTGSVIIDNLPGQSPTGTGMVVMEDGRYRAYGQTLTIERGRLAFSGPVDNPALEIHAMRKVADADVEVGVAIAGTLKRPSVNLRANPAMPETEVLAYLLTGSPLSDASHTDRMALIGMALDLTASQTQPLTKQLGDRIGLDTVKVRNEGNTLKESSLLLGKRLTSKLYVGYVQGIFENTRTFEAEYRITDALSIKARSSDEQRSAEFIYSIERN